MFRFLIQGDGGSEKEVEVTSYKEQDRFLTKFLFLVNFGSSLVVLGVIFLREIWSLGFGESCVFLFRILILKLVKHLAQSIPMTW
jgi:hypothetical protein